jgi:alpha-L-fucosidase
MLETPWNKGNCLGPWHYSISDYNRGYQKTGAMIHLLVDVVSKNGTFLLAIPLPGSGEIDDKATAFLDEMTKWMAINSECIYDTRPWMIYGEGPSVQNDATAKSAAVNPPRGLGPNLTVDDIRFTTKGTTLYAIVMGKPTNNIATIRSLATNSPHYSGEIGSVQLLGSGQKLAYARNENGMSVTLPTGTALSDYANTLKITPKS